jgi:saccharopine dehydrogenase (NAD+, L-lysine-forming)
MKMRIGIRREDKNPWERRAVLIPTHVREILKDNPLEIWLQPSSIRVFSDRDYLQEGARIEENLAPCPIIFAVKEIPLQFFTKEKVYIFFSHTIKGQSQNMAMLKRMMDLRCTLIDYERIVNEKGQRLLFFGFQAGQAGMLDTLWALGQRLNHEKIENPFSLIKLAHEYGSLVAAKEAVKKVGWQVHDKGLDASLVPLVFGFAGYGHVSQGAQEIFNLLPHQEVKPEKIASFFEQKNYAANRVYKVVFEEKHMVKPLQENKKFDLQDYYDNPQKYESIFSAYLPFLTGIVNCIFWTPKYPRFVTKKSLRRLFMMENKPRLRIIGDISCDIEGSVECTVQATTPDNPVFVYDPFEEKASNGVEGRGIVVMAIDNLPAEIPLESSIFFSNALKPLVSAIARADFSGNFENCNLPNSVKKAVIIYRGKFTPDYEYMKNFIKKFNREKQ